MRFEPSPLAKRDASKEGRSSTTSGGCLSKGVSLLTSPGHNDKKAGCPSNQLHSIKWFDWKIIATLIAESCGTRVSVTGYLATPTKPVYNFGWPSTKL